MPASSSASTWKVPVIETHTLSTGATLLFMPMAEAPRLAFSVFLPGGNCAEAVPGLSDLVDRLVLKGTESRSQEDIAIALDGLSLEMDTDTKRDYSMLAGTLLPEDLDEALELLADVFLNSTLAEWAREKQQIAGEVQMDLDAPKSQASDQFIRTLFEQTPYNVVGSVLAESLEAMTEAMGQTHYRNIYHPGRMLITMAGNVRAETLLNKLEAAFSVPKILQSSNQHVKTQKVRPVTRTQDTVVTLARDESNQAHIYKGWVAPAADHPDYYTLIVLNTILGGGGLSSRLFVNLRDKQGLAYNVRSSYEAFRQAGMFSLYIGTEPSNKDKCLAGFVAECQDMIDRLVPAQELAEAKQNLLGRRAVFLETALQQVGYIGGSRVLGRSLEDIAQLPERIQAVTAQDVQRVAEGLFTQPAVISIVAPSTVL